MILLDTGPLIYHLHDLPALSKPARRAADRAGSSIGVSAASIYEIRTKATAGSWREVRRYALADLSPLLVRCGVTIFALTGEIMDRAAEFSWHHKDPFDRMIAATAWQHDLPLISEDTRFDDWAWDGYKRIW